MRRLAEASGIATPTRAELARFDRSRKNFGANGQRVLDGLVGSLDREVILASLSGHVRLKVDQLGDALRLELPETDRMLLADLLDEHDTLTRRVSGFDRYIDQALVSYAEACRLLETIPGIDRTRVLRPTGRPASAYPRNTGGIYMMNDEMCVVHARAAGLDVYVVTVTCWNWFAFAGDVAAQDGAIGRFVSIGTARAERADPAGSVPTKVSARGLRPSHSPSAARTRPRPTCSTPRNRMRSERADPRIAATEAAVGDPDRRGAYDHPGMQTITDRLRLIEALRLDVGADDVDAVELLLGRDLLLVAAIGEALVGDLGHEVLGHLVAVDHLPDAQADVGRAA